MVQALMWIKLLLSIGPAIIEFIKKLEEMMPEGGKGAEKLALVKAYLEGIWNTLGKAVPAFEEAWPKIEAIIATLVSWFNKVGIFKK